MIGTLFTEHLWLWTLAWQTTVCLAVGLAGSFLLRRRPARAHQLLLIGLLASALMPGSYAMVKHLDRGLLIESAAPAQREAIEMSPADEAQVEIVFVPQRQEVSLVPAISGQSVLPAGTGRKVLMIPWRTVALLCWMVASALLLAHLGLRFALGVRLLRTTAPMQSERICRAVEAANRRLGIRGAVRVRSSEQVHSPIIWCWAPVPVLLVQADAPDRESDTDWVGIFCHELAHWKRLDHVSGLLAELLVCVLPWHPLLWWARGRLLWLSEQVCDDWALAGGLPGADYAESLLGLSAERRMAFVPTVVGKEKAMKARIRRIITDRCGDPRIGRRWALVVAALALLATMGVAVAQRRPAPPERRQPEDRREVREPREQQEAQERIVARQREALQRMLDDLAGRIREKEMLLRERGDELGEERPVIELEADLLREQAEQMERRLRNLERELQEPPRAGDESWRPPLPPEEFEARFGEMARHREELGEEAGRIERQMGQLGDGQDEEARELQTELRRVHEQIRNIEREMADLQRARAQLQRARAMEEAQRARAESDRAREAAERTRDLAQRQRDLRVRMQEIQRELERHPPDSDEHRALRRELDGIQEEITGTEQELNEVQRGRAALDRGRRDVERRRREEAAVQRDELLAHQRELGEQVRRTEGELHELEEQGRGNTDESHERRQVLDQLLAEMESLDERVRSRVEGPVAPRVERRAEGRGRVITRIFKLKYAHPEQMAAILRGLADPGSRVIPDERTGSLVVSSTPEGQEQLERIIQELDVPGEDRGRAGPEGGRALENEVEELRGQVRGLHDQMQQMREMLQRLVERSQNEEPGERR